MQETKFTKPFTINLRGQAYSADLNEVSDIHLLALLKPFKDSEMGGDEQELIRIFTSPVFQASFTNALRHIFEGLPEGLVYYRGEDDWRFNLKTSDLMAIIQAARNLFEQEAIAQSPEPVPTPSEDDGDRPLTQRDLIAILEAVNGKRPKPAGFAK